MADAKDAVKRNGSWTIRVSLTDPDTGTRTQKRLTARTKRELEALVVELKNSWNKGTYVEPDSTKFGDYLRKFLDGLKRSESTRFQYEHILRHHVATDPIAAIPLGRLRRSHFQRFLDGRVAAGYSAATVRQIHAMCTSALKRAVKLGIIAANPAQELDLPPLGRAAPQVWSQEETRTFLAGIADRDDAALWTLAVTVGLRQGELMALRWDDLDQARGTLTVRRTLTRTTKGKWRVGDEAKTESGQRTIQLPAICRDALKAHRTHQLERRLRLGDIWQEHGMIFDAGDGQPIAHPETLARRFRRIITALGLPPITPHGLRHTAATNMLKNHVPVHVVAQILGHANPAVTLKVYAHVLADAQAEAVARLDALFA